MSFYFERFTKTHCACENKHCSPTLGVRVLHAFHTFRGHSKPVQDIVACPFDSNFFVSVGADRCLKLWDHRNTDADLPVSEWWVDIG